MKKSYPRKNASIKSILNGIREGIFYTSSLFNKSDNYKPVHGFQDMTVDIKAFDFVDIDKRYILQKAEVPTGKRGNLSVFAGEKVEVIALTVTRNGRISFLIRLAK